MSACLLVCAFALLTLASYCTSSKMMEELEQSINKARSNPKHYKEMLSMLYISKGIYGTSNDKYCYMEALKYLDQREPLPELEPNAVARLVSSRHSKYMKENSVFSHYETVRRSLKERLEEVGEWEEKYAYGEVIGYSYAKLSTDVQVMEWIAGCGVLVRGDRSNIFNSKYKTIGCAAYDRYTTCIFTKPIHLKPELPPQLLQELNSAQSAQSAQSTQTSSP